MHRYCGRCQVIVPANEYASHVDGHRPPIPGWQKLRKVVLARDGHRCQVCGSTIDLEIHHISGDPSDNRLENLLTVCLPHNPRGPAV